MDKFINKVVNLIEVKKIIALVTIFVFCGLAIADKVETGVFTNVVTLVVGYYFGQSTAKQTIKENE